MNLFTRIVLILSTLFVGLAGLTAASDCPICTNVTMKVKSASICPFCTAVQQTITEQIGTSDVVVVAELITLPSEPPKDDQLPKAQFRVTEVIKGLPDIIAAGHEFKSIYVGQPHVGESFLLMGVDPPDIAWSTPLKLSAAAAEYLRAITKLPAKGIERLKFFQSYFEHAESMLAFDAYEEFARASYAEVIELKPFMNRAKLLEWIQNPDVSTSRKRLYFTLLGVCGTAEDLPLLESLISSDVNENRRGLDAIVACYLTLKGDSGLELIEKQFFENPKSEYVDTFAAISAIRFLATERQEFSRERILAALHKVLDRPTLADLVIPDLARWEDWTVIDKMVELFKESTEETKWVRVPVVSYLQVCPKPEAKQAIEQLKLIDPESVRRAETLLKWESGEDEFEDTETKTGEAPETKDSKSGTPDTKKSGGESPGDGPTADLINVPVYEVKRLPSDISGIPTVDRLTDPTATEQYVSTASPNASTKINTPEVPPLRVEPNLVASGPSIQMTMGIIFVPLGSFVVLLLLLWSVLSGWFERLIY